MNKNAMVPALKAVLVPLLRERGFKGTFPHFRRLGANQIDLLSVTFDRLGSGFFVEIAKCRLEGITTHGGEQIPPNKVKALDVYPPNRPRLGFTSNGGSGIWFKYDDGTAVDIVARRAVQYLPEADEWWSK